MSMLSAQIDELRKAAEYYDGSEVASIMRDAADTIWQLRDDLQRANAATLGPCSDSCNCTNGERTDLAAENAKLRELAREACQMARAFYNLGGTFNDLDDLLCEAAELGIEVDG